MRLNKLFTISLLILSTLALQSCLKDQEDIFDESSSERLQAALDNAKTVLTSSPEGWLFDYYPDRDISYGGFIYALKFDSKNVTVWSEIAPDMEETSLYRLTDDNGPMLSFDSYNTLMHYFANPFNGEPASGYEGMDGDFEFVIMDVTDDLITLRGKRTGNTMYLHRMTENAAAYIKSLSKVTDRQVISQYAGTIGSQAVSCDIDIEKRYMEFIIDGNVIAEEYYLPTPAGIRFRNPVEINGATITELNFTFNDADNTSTYTGTDSNGAAVALTGELDASYAFKETFDGEFILSYDNGNKQANVTLVPDPNSDYIKITGVSSAFDLIATYNTAKGCMELCGQQIGLTSTASVLFLPGTNTGFYNNSSVGYYFVRDPENPTTYVTVPNGSTAADCANSFVIVLYTGSGYYLPSAPWLINGDYLINNIVGFIKK